MTANLSGAGCSVGRGGDGDAAIGGPTAPSLWTTSTAIYSSDPPPARTNRLGSRRQIAVKSGVDS